MPDTTRRGHACAIGIMAVLLAVAAPADAHDKKGVGTIQLTIGWGDEPAFSGVKNSVEIGVTDASGTPVKDLDGPLAVHVSYGDRNVVLPLLPIRDRPGTFHAWLVPTRAGTYTFRITGKAKGQAIDATSTCSDKTFDCVIDAAELQFPAKDPSTGQLADGLGRALPRTERAMDTAARARTIAIAASVVAALSLATTIAVVLQKSRKRD